MIDASQMKGFIVGVLGRVLPLVITMGFVLPGMVIQADLEFPDVVLSFSGIALTFVYGWLYSKFPASPRVGWTLVGLGLVGGAFPIWASSVGAWGWTDRYTSWMPDEDLRMMAAMWLWIWSGFLALWMYIGHVRNCPSCNYFFAREVVSATSGDSWVSYEDEERTDVLYTKRGKKFGTVKRVEQVATRNTRVHGELRCGVCGFEWEGSWVNSD